MLDIRLIREQPDLVKGRLATRGGAENVATIDEVLRVDAERRKAETALQQLNADRKRLSKEIGGKRSRGESSDELETQVREIGDQISLLNQQTSAADEQQKTLLLGLPNLPHSNAPIGNDASANPVVRTWGEKAEPSGPVLDHVALGTKLGLFDLERAAKLSGSGFICFTGAGARLERALINLMLDLHTREHGYLEMSPPFLVRRECMVGTTQLPKFEEDMYGLENNQLFLAPTAEVPVTNFHREEILAASELPKKFVAYTPCFRREAGSAGRETRGIIRVHQFDKVEMVKITTPESSYAEHESMTANAERVLQLLELPYRVIELCTGDMGFRRGEGIRHRGLVAGPAGLSRSVELLQLRRFSGPPDESAVQGCGGEEPLLPYVEWFRPGVAQSVCGVDRDVPAAGWIDSDSRKVAAILWRGRDSLTSCS